MVKSPENRIENKGYLGRQNCKREDKQKMSTRSNKAAASHLAFYV